MSYLNKKVGVLGGGQLGKMLAQAAGSMGMHLAILDKSVSFPAGMVCRNFVEGDFRAKEDVLEFGRTVDIVTVEIESVHTEALHLLKEENVKIHPGADALELIGDKGRQKEFYRQKGFPTADFVLVEDADEIHSLLSDGTLRLPFVQKTRRGGYDGRGVQLIETEDRLGDVWPIPSIIEDVVNIQKELAVIAARNEQGQITTYPVVEMVFNPQANLVEFIFTPASVAAKISDQAIQIASKLIVELDIVGLLAVEMFLTHNGEVFVNEVAPRPHNSGHLTIEAAMTSQFHQHLRCILGLPLGNTDLLSPAVMINLLGEPGYEGSPKYEGLEDVLKFPGAHVHLYGKDLTKPHRKMGHVTVLGHDMAQLMETARHIKSRLKVIA